MKLPLGWLSEFVTIQADTAEISRRLTLAGLEVEAVERLTPRFEGVVVAKVLKAERHPNADRLSLCEVDAGDGKRYSIVCGAPNVRSGMIGAFARVGARLGGLAKEAGAALETIAPLEAATIRGVRSEGMLCSERELGFSAEHAGIVGLDDDAPIGADLASYLQLEDTVLDIAVLPNRGDCLSILGLARELAALFGVKLRPPKAPALKANAASNDTAMRIEIAAPDLCPHYAALRMTDVKLGPSPIRIRRRLELCGMRALNNVVDATNYVMLETGQPLHAFDAERLEGGRIVVRRAGDDREFVTLDNMRRELRPDDLMIADGAQALAIAGVMGGLNSEVGVSTRSLLLESAYFEPITIARTARRLGLRSEASYRFERGIDRAGQLLALARVAELIGQLAGGRVAGGVIDVEPRRAVHRAIALAPARLAALLGVQLPVKETRRRLVSLGAKVSADRSRFKVVPPSYRSDLNSWEDLAEEVARFSGMSDIPAQLPQRSSIATAPDPRRELIARTREALIGCGLTEVKTIAFAAPADNQGFAGLKSPTAVAIVNPLSTELSELRLSLLPGLLGALRFNLNREAESFHAFEIAKVFYASGRLIEEERLAAIGYGTLMQSSLGTRSAKTGFLAMKGLLENYLETIGVRDCAEFKPVDPDRATCLHPGKAAQVLIDGTLYGYLGELHPAHARRLDLRDPCALLELDFGKIIAYGSRRQTIAVSAPPRFPAITRDLAMVLDRDFPADAVLKAVTQMKTPMLESVQLFDCYEGPPLPAGKKSIALSCRYRAADRTLTDDEVNRAHATLVRSALERLGAELRQ